MSGEKIMVVVFVPCEDADRMLEAISMAGGGIIGDYTHCGFMSEGFGRFKPSATADPHVGEKGVINGVEETRIETFCERKVAKQVVAAIRAAHPYQEPVFYLIPLLSEDEL